jgi:protocatechuate 3,4-dioxygenase beta subunit
MRGRTPHHTTGPFFPAQFIAAGENDLTRLPGSAAEARGRKLRLEGRVVDGMGQPAVNVILELWQADARGVFHDPADPRFAERDPGFAGWGRTWTDEEGRYRFLTVMPGPYPSGTDAAWIRPPHLRLLVLGSGIMRPLVTEVFFPGEPLTAGDRLLAAVADPERRARLSRAGGRAGLSIRHRAPGRARDALLRGLSGRRR